MPQLKEKKEVIFSQIQELLKDKKPLILIDYRGLKGNEIALFRKNLKEKMGSLKIIKTSLFKRALKKTDMPVAEDILNRPVAIIYNAEPIGLSKLVYEFSQSHSSLEILGGIFDGRFNDSSEIKELALLPGKEELQSRLIRTLNAPLYKLFLSLSNLPNRLISVLKYKLNQSEA